jgi:hypothetical protein
MKGYHIFFFLMKLVIITQFILIIGNKQSIDSRVYILTEIVFKTSLFIFIQWFLIFNVGRDLEIEDRVIFSFAGGLLLYDAWFNDMRRLLQVLDIKFPILNP